MSELLPRLRAREVIRALQKDGWEDVKGKGGHRHFTHPAKPGRVTVPVHETVDIDP